MIGFPNFFCYKMMYCTGWTGGWMNGDQKCTLTFFISSNIEYKYALYKKCPNKFLVGLKIWTSWGEALTIFQITMLP